MSKERTRTQEMITALKQQRDDLAVRIHLAEAEVKEDLGRIDDKLDQLSHRFDPLKNAVGTSASDVWESLKLLGDEVKKGLDRISKAL